MFLNYLDNNVIEGVKAQHNIMVFIGNGFDISILDKYRNDKLITSYNKFYDFLCYKGFNDSNILVKKMVEDRKNKKDNWSDFENSIGELLQCNCDRAELNGALKEIQDMFLIFLNEVVNPELLLTVNKQAEDNQWATRSLSSFLGDLRKEDLKKMNFSYRTNHYHMFNYLFVNFNYTSLFDNYIYLDKKQFEANPMKTVNRNFYFHPNPNCYDNKGNETVWSAYLMTNLIHPHGYQSIPRSLLFGIEEDNYNENPELKRFNKSYWAQNEQKYTRSINDADLFIIYGTSIGETDKWWWNSICASLLSDDKESELIIYYYNDHKYTIDEVKQIFIDTCKCNFSDSEISKLKKKIFVVLHENTENLNMFGFS